MMGPFNGCDMPEKIPNRFKIAIFLLSLAPIAGGFGLWLIFPLLSVTGNACVLCSPSIGINLSLAPIDLAQALIGTVFSLLGVALFVSSLGLFTSKNDVQATRWVRWLGRLRPKIRDRTIIPSPDPDKYRRYALVILLLSEFTFDILLIYVCWRALSVSMANGSSREATDSSRTTAAIAFFDDK